MEDDKVERQIRAVGKQLSKATYEGKLKESTLGNHDSKRETQIRKATRKASQKRKLRPQIRKARS